MKVRSTKLLRASVPIVLLTGSLAFMALSRLTGVGLVEIPSSECLRSLNPLLIPVVFTAAYVARAGATLVFAFTLAGLIGELLPKQVAVRYLGEEG